MKSLFTNNIPQHILYGAGPQVRNNFGQQPIDLANAMNWENVKRILS